jgi:hypothetical protein
MKDSSPPACQQALTKFGKQLKSRHLLRKQKSEKEERYFGKVD